MAAVAKFVDNVVQNCQEKQKGHQHLNWHQFIISHFMQKQQKWEMIGSLLVCLCMGLQLDASGGLFPSTSKDEIFPPFPFFFAGYITASLSLCLDLTACLSWSDFIQFNCIGTTFLHLIASTHQFFLLLQLAFLKPFPSSVSSSVPSAWNAVAIVKFYVEFCAHMANKLCWRILLTTSFEHDLGIFLAEWLVIVSTGIALCTSILLKRRTKCPILTITRTWVLSMSKLQ